MTAADGYGSWGERVPILSTEAKFGVKLERLQGDKVPVNAQTTQSVFPLFPSSTPVPLSSADLQEVLLLPLGGLGLSLVAQAANSKIWEKVPCCALPLFRDLPQFVHHTPLNSSALFKSLTQLQDLNKISRSVYKVSAYRPDLLSCSVFLWKFQYAK